MRSLRRLLLTLVVLLSATSCDKRIITPPVEHPALGLLCPPATTGLSVDSLNGATGTVNIVGSVQTSGGVPPASANCAGHMDGVFPIGTTTVSCTGSDSINQTASCSFPVTVNAVPRLQYTKILAFGDSITWGLDTPPASLRLKSVNIPGSYPSNLQDLLNARYRLQTITVTNAGEWGEGLWDFDNKAVKPATLQRFQTELDAARPEVLLLMEGVNDLNYGGAHYDAISGFDILLSEAQRRGIKVLASSLTPSTRDPKSELIPLYNDLLFDLVRRRPPAIFVDMYARFATDPLLIGNDGLHPTKEGFKVMAEVWANALKAFETTALTQPTGAGIAAGPRARHLQ